MPQPVFEPPHVQLAMYNGCFHSWCENATFVLKYKCMTMGWLGSCVLVHLWCYVQAGRLQNGKTCRDVCPRKRERKNQNKNPLIVPLCAGWEAGKGQLRAWPPTDQTHFLTWPLCPLPNYIPIKAAPDCKQVVKERKSEDKISSNDLALQKYWGMHIMSPCQTIPIKVLRAVDDAIIGVNVIGSHHLVHGQWGHFCARPFFINSFLLTMAVVMRSGVLISSLVISDYSYMPQRWWGPF